MMFMRRREKHGSPTKDGSIWIILGFVALLGLAVVQVSDAAVSKDGVCRIFSMLPLTEKPNRTESNYSEYETWNNESSAKYGFDLLSSALMAIDHFNDRNPIVVDELPSLGINCSVVLRDPSVADTKWDADESVNQAFYESYKSMQPPPGSEVVRKPEDETAEPKMCVVLGPASETAATAVSTVTSALDVPQMVFNSASEELLSVDSPTTVGVSLSVQGEALAMVEYLNKTGREQLVIVTTSGPKTTDLTNAITLEGRNRGENFTVLSTEITDSLYDDITMEQEMLQAIDYIVSTGIKTIFLNIPDSVTLVQFAHVLAEYKQKDMFSNDRVYIILPDAFPADRGAEIAGLQSKDSPVHKLLNGAMLFDRLDSFRYEANSTFLQAWKELDASFLKRVKKILAPNGINFDPPADYFQTNIPSNYATFVYDAVMTIGLGGCRQQLGESYLDRTSRNRSSTDNEEAQGYPPPESNQNDNNFGQPPPQGSYGDNFNHQPDNPFGGGSEIFGPNNPPESSGTSGGASQLPAVSTNGSDLDVSTEGNQEPNTSFQETGGGGGQQQDSFGSNQQSQNNGGFGIQQPNNSFGEQTGEGSSPPQQSFGSNQQPSVSGGSSEGQQGGEGNNSFGTNQQQPSDGGFSGGQGGGDGSGSPQDAFGTNQQPSNIGFGGGQRALRRTSRMLQRDSNKPPNEDFMWNPDQGRRQPQDFEPGQRKSKPLDRLDPLVIAMTEVTFHGASGPVQFLEGRKVRDASDVTVGLYNIRPDSRRRLDSTLLNETSQAFEFALTSIYQKSISTNTSAWLELSGDAFVYRDGTNESRESSREFIQMNLLSGWVRGIGLTLMATTLVASLGCSLCIYVFRKDGVISRSQPFFMHLLCFGSLVMSISILTLSFDEGSGWSTQQLSVACMATPWFFFIGQIITFSALFTKLWRLDKVLQFRRGNRVTVANVIGPLLALLTITVVILIVWTTVDPWTWKIDVLKQVPAESYGQCTSHHFWAFFGPLMGLLILSEGLTAFYAWKTSDVPEDFRDTNAVFYAIVTQLQAWLIGVPILSVLNTSSANATYFGRVLLIWIFSMSSLCLVVAQKILKAYFLRRNPQLLNKGSRVKVSGVAMVPPTVTVRNTSSSLAQSGAGRLSSEHGISGLSCGSGTANLENPSNSVPQNSSVEQRSPPEQACTSAVHRG